MFDDREQFWAYFSKLSFKALAFLLLLFSGLFFICLGLYYLFMFSNSIKDNCSSCDFQRVSSQEVTANIYVDISGAIDKPGIYYLDHNSRVADLVKMAGGFSYQADKKYLAQNFNLASSLTDGEKIYIPFSGELKSESNNKNLSLISINNCSENQLQSLEGIGEKRAQDIIAGRPYSNIQQLVEKEIITQKIFDAIKDNIEL